MADAAAGQTKSMDAIMALCKRRGFVYQASEIYGGINGFWDYGPLGAQLKKNLRDAWWQDVVMNPCWGKKGPDGESVRTVPLDTTIIQHPKVWEASGHIAGFNDPMQTCRQCKKLFRADHRPQMLENAEWYRALLAAWFAQGADGFVRGVDESMFADDQARLAEWVKRYGKKQAPNLPLVTGFKQVTEAVATFFRDETEDRSDLRTDAFPIIVNYGRPKNTDICPNCGGDLTEPRQFNLMFKTYIGATATEDDIAYLRPETAQGIFVQFKNVVDTTRVKVPFGIAQTGKAFRNEVTPRNFTFRSREFEQMEIEFFCHPEQAKDWYAFWRDWRMAWWESIGLKGENLQLREHERDELAHYAKDGAGTSDIEYRFPFTAPGFGELEGIAHRTDFDLRQHAEHSGLKDNLKYFDTTRGELAPNGQPKGEKYFPHVIEPSAGLDRGVLAVLCESYSRDETRPSPEIMRFHPRLAPIKAAVFPLVNKDGMPEVAEKLHTELVKKFGRHGFVETDAKQSIGKRYARMDEAGCPFCFTVDGDTLKDSTVTVRDRDTGAQERIALDRVASYLGEKLGL